MKKSLTVCVTGAAGQIAYSFIPQLLSGNAFPDVAIRLRLLDIPQSENIMKGVILEIHDGTFPLLESVQSTSDPKVGFKDADVIVFLGGFPRKPGMQRKDLLQMNKKIFVNQAKALDVTSPDCKCVVIANPANTNAYILSKFAPQNFKKENITCLTRLDHNRATSQIATKTNCRTDDVEGVMIFGNHSLTQYPCIEHIKVKGKPIKGLVQEEWLKNTFISNVQKRGGEILSARGASSVFSAATAVIHHLRDWYSGTEKIVSMGVISKGQYGVPEGIWSSFPVRCKGFNYEIVDDITLSEFCKDNIKITCDELQEEIQLAEL